jgi:Protein of unknown function (DUF3102)
MPKLKPLTETDRNRAGALVGEAIAEHKAIRGDDQSMLDHAIAAGVKLLEAQAIIGHGRWGKWVTDNLGEIGSHRTATRYMRLAEHREAIKANWPRVAKITDEEGLTSIRAADKLVAELAAAADPESKRNPIDKTPADRVAGVVKAIHAEPAADIISQAIEDAKLPPVAIRSIVRRLDPSPSPDLVEATVEEIEQAGRNLVELAKDIVDRLDKKGLEEIAAYIVNKAKSIEPEKAAA